MEGRSLGLHPEALPRSWYFALLWPPSASRQPRQECVTPPETRGRWSTVRVGTSDPALHRPSPYGLSHRHSGSGGRRRKTSDPPVRRRDPTEKSCRRTSPSLRCSSALGRRARNCWSCREFGHCFRPRRNLCYMRGRTGISVATCSSCQEWGQRQGRRLGEPE